MALDTFAFGTTPEGRTVTAFRCVNRDGLALQMIDYGAIVVSMETPDRAGRPANINLGFSSLEGYLQRHPYFGSTVGRYCNRIAQGRFTLDGAEYHLATNNGPNHLHGGERGFDQLIWESEPIDSDSLAGVRFRCVSPDGDEGYPGELQAEATYTLSDAGVLTIDFTATTNKATPLNLTNHCYWNLRGQGGGPIYDHELTLGADSYLEVDANLIPTGRKVPVDGTPFDFREAKSLGCDLRQIEADPPGYDHCFVLSDTSGDLAFAARVRDPESGRTMEVHTTQPGIQLYTGNFLDGSPSCGGFAQHGAFCLETQHFPDSPNQPAFPTTILRPGETFRQTTVHRFGVD